MAQSSTLSVGWDVYKESIAGVYTATDSNAAVVCLGSIGTRQCDIETLVRQRQSQANAAAWRRRQTLEFSSSMWYENV
jgi:hypothetical protein